MDLSVHQSGAAASPPSPPASPSVGYPTPGNPGTGLAASIPGAYWRYQLQAEMAAVLTAAGLTASSTTLTQLLAAIRALADARITYQFGTTDTTPDKCSLTTNGWQLLPSGLLVQWGQASATSTVSEVTLPLAFPTALLTVVTSNIGLNTGVIVVAAPSVAAPKAQFRIQTNNATSWLFGYIALGY